MAKQTVNPGTAPTGAGGDTFRSGSAKLQANDDELYAQLGATDQGVLPAALPLNKGGTGATTAVAARTNLGLGSAATVNTGNGVGQAPIYSVLGLSDFGYGGDARTVTLVGGLVQPEAANALNKTQFFGTSASWNNSPLPGTNTLNQGIGMHVKANVTGYDWQFWNPLQTVSPKIRLKNNGVFGAWIDFRTAANTTVDANGFIKNASPIVKVFADKIEMNDEAQQQPITFEKLGVGDYLIKGSSGFAQEGWYIETPKDANGNVLFSVIYTTLVNGDISVKTHKKKFDFETVSIVADLDNPVDITEGRWIDLRLQELPQPEPEETESIAPPEFQPTGLAEAVATVMESYDDTEQ